MQKKDLEETSVSDGYEPGRASEISKKVHFLFEVCRKPNGEHYTYLEVEELTNGNLYTSWLSKLGSGKVTSPDLWKLKALSDFFGVSFDLWLSPLNEEMIHKIETERLNRPLEFKPKVGRPLAVVKPEKTDSTYYIDISDLNEEQQESIISILRVFRKANSNTNHP